MATRSYYTLVASLPALPHFERAERLPINFVRLGQRLRMLEPADQELVERAAAFLAWQSHPALRTDAEVVAMYEGFADLRGHRTLRALIEYRMNQRTILAALRRRQRGLGPPAAGAPWGVGAYVQTIGRNWGDPDFKLGAVVPWLHQAREYLAAGETLALERLLLDAEWKWLDSVVVGHEFSFDWLLVYLFRWDILNQWLSHDAEAAEQRFEELVAEVTGEHYQLFN